MLFCKNNKKSKDYRQRTTDFFLLWALTLTIDSDYWLRLWLWLWLWLLTLTLTLTIDSDYWLRLWLWLLTLTLTLTVDFEPRIPPHFLNSHFSILVPFTATLLITKKVNIFYIFFSWHKLIDIAIFAIVFIELK